MPTNILFIENNCNTIIFTEALATIIATIIAWSLNLMINQVLVRPCACKKSLMSYQKRLRPCDCKNTTANFTKCQSELLLVRNSLILSPFYMDRITWSKNSINFDIIQNYFDSFEKFLSLSF